MEPIVLDTFSWSIDREALARRLRLTPESEPWGEVMSLVEHAEAIGRPRALYGVAYIADRDDDHLIVDGERLSSRVLRVNVGEANRLFPYVATCGVELEAWADALDDMLHSFWSEAIREAALRCALAACLEHLHDMFQPGQTATMNPGSLADWPLAEQRPLFRLLGDPEGLIGVRLLPSLLMVPRKSVSGVRFTTEEAFESCMLCPRPDCPGRRAPYNARLHGARYESR